LARQAIYIILFIAVITCCTTVKAQLCQGSLGDPVVNITFGAGSNPGPPLSAAGIGYTYFAGSCPNDGLYTITNSESGCFGGAWHNLSADHTGNPNGYFMIVNASYQPSDFFLDTVRGLCPNTTYEFASWVINLMNPNPGAILPNITFSIEETNGNVLKSYNTGDIPMTTGPVWTQYGFYFTTPPNTSTVVLRMKNNAPGGEGNDLALDDITFRPCGPMVTINLDGSTSTKTVCAGDGTAITASSTISPATANMAYQWQLSTDNGVTWTDITGASSPTYAIPPATQKGTYEYRLTIAQANNLASPACRVASNIAIVTANTTVPLNVTAGPACLGKAMNLYVTGDGGYTFQWSGPGNFSSNNEFPIITPVVYADSGMYKVTITSPDGCSASDSILVKVYAVPSVSAGPDTSICKGSSVQLSGGGTGTSYTWTPAAGLSANNIANPVATPDSTTTYLLTVSDGTCHDTASAIINILDKPVANAGSAHFIFEGQSITLNGTAGGSDISYYWTPGNYFISNPGILQPVVSPLQDTTYTLHVVSVACGTAADSVFVRVYAKIAIPNAFSPNNDGVNDVWNIEKLYTYPGAEVSVYNRYGQQVFSSKGYATPWDGKYNGNPLPVGVYYYLIDLKIGTPVLSGSLLIIR